MPRFRRLVALFFAAALILVALPSLAYEQELGRLAGQLAEKLASDSHHRIAVVDFTELDGDVTLLGRFLAEELSISLSENGPAFQVVDRQRLSVLLKEHKLSLSGLLEPNSIRRLGKIAGVGALVTGSITPFGETVRVSIKVLDVETATMIASGRGNIPKTGAIANLLDSHGLLAQGPGTVKEAQSKVHSTEQMKFIFELHRCELTSQTIDCHLLVNNSGKSRELTIYGYTVLFDDAGNEYNVSNVQVANSTRSMGRQDHWVTKTLLYEIPVQTSLTFHGISPQATRVGELRIVCEVEGQRFLVSFRDVSLDSKQVPRIQAAAGSGSVLPSGDRGGLPSKKKKRQSLGRGIADDLKKEARKTAKGLIEEWGRKALGGDEEKR